MGDYRQADPATREDVDELILDYLLYMAAKALLRERNTEQQAASASLRYHEADTALNTVDGK